MPGEKILLSDLSEGILTLTLNRPEKLNAVSYELLRETAAAIDELNEEAAVRVVVIRGAGRAFSSGTDLHVHAVLPLEGRTMGDQKGSQDGVGHEGQKGQAEIPVLGQQ